MKFICPFIFAVLLAVPLWAKTSYYILPVHLENVHEDYAKVVVQLTSEYIENDGDEVVSNKSNCDYLLQIKLIQKEVGVALAYEKKSKDEEILWSYAHIAYSPEDFIPVVSYVVREMDRWEKEFICGFGFGAIGLIAPIKFVDYNYQPFVQFNVESIKMAADLSIAFLGSKPKGVHGSVLGVSLSVAYMFGHRFIVPYLGAGANYGLVWTEVKKEKETRFGQTIEESVSESVCTPGYFLEFGLSLKMKNEIHVMLESRYFREFNEIKNIHDGTKSVVHGFSVGVKFGL